MLPPGSPVVRAASASVAEPETTDGLGGALYATWHISEAGRPRAPVTGTVQRIRLVRQFTVREDDSRTIVRAGARLTELAASRDHFARGPATTREDSWEETGLLVDLTTDLGDVITSVWS